MSAADFHPRLMEASNATERMELLCEFIEFWLGPRKDGYGESPEKLNGYRLPAPLRRLYEFAGRWPGVNESLESPWEVGAFSCQDSLRPLEKLEWDSEGKVKFLVENQGIWMCKTLPDGDDPPVWCEGEVFNERGELVEEIQACDSLSRFLVTSVLQETSLGSRFTLADDGLSKHFEETKDQAKSIWINGPYIQSSDYNFYLWNGVLVAGIWDDYWFGANDISAIEFLADSQGAISMVGLSVGVSWRLDIEDDGSAKVGFYAWPVEEDARVPAGTFDFENLRDAFSGLVSAEGHSDRNPMVFFQRRGQSSSRGRHIHDLQLVTDLFRQALDRSAPPNAKLDQLYREFWPY